MNSISTYRPTNKASIFSLEQTTPKFSGNSSSSMRDITVNKLSDIGKDAAKKSLTPEYVKKLANDADVQGLARKELKTLLTPEYVKKLADDANVQELAKKQLETLLTPEYVKKLTDDANVQGLAKEQLETLLTPEYIKKLIESSELKKIGQDELQTMLSPEYVKKVLKSSDAQGIAKEQIETLLTEDFVMRQLERSRLYESSKEYATYKIYNDLKHNFNKNKESITLVGVGTGLVTAGNTILPWVLPDHMCSIATIAGLGTIAWNGYNVWLNYEPPKEPEVITVVKKEKKSLKDSLNQSVSFLAQGKAQEAFKVLINLGADANFVDPNTKKPILSLAAESDNKEILKEILEANTELEEQGPLAVKAAMKRNQYEAANDIQKRPNFPETLKEKIPTIKINHALEREAKKQLILRAAESDNPEELKFLLRNSKFELNEIAGENKYTPLCAAAAHGRSVNIDTLLEQLSLNPLATDKDGNTALYHSLERYGDSKDDITEKLLSAGVSPNIFPSKSLAPIHLAAKNNNLKGVKALLKHGANINEISTKEHKTPIMLSDEAKMIEFLFANGADLNIKDIYGKSAASQLPIVEIAEETSNSKVLKELGKTKTNLNKISGSYKYTPLCGAAYYGQNKNINTLLESGADPQLKGESGATALWYAVASQSNWICGKSSKDSIEKLLKAGINPNDFPKGSDSPLKTAKQKGNNSTVQLLKKYGAVK